jgi:hypothetical protein
MTGERRPDPLPDIVGPRFLVELVAPLFPDNSVRAVSPAEPIRYQWIRDGAFLEYQTSGRRPPRMMVLVLTDNELTLLDAHFRHFRVRLWREFSHWASWPLGSIEAELADNSFLPKLTIRLRDSDKAFPFTVLLGRGFHANREAADFVESAINAAAAMGS